MARAANPNLKRANIEVEFTHDQVVELKKCSQDPVYFIENYVRIQHPTRGAIPFDLYKYQKKMIREFAANRYVVVLSARQTGKSVVSAAYLLWYAVFHFDKTILIASNKNANAMEMILRIRYAYEQLPTWLKPGVTDDGWNKHNIGFDNDSRIVSTATSEDAGRGMSISLLYLDEFAFVSPSIQEDFWTSIQPTLSTGGSCIMTSTPNGDMNIFAQIWRGAEVQANGFRAIRVRWNEPPGRDEAFKEETIAKLGERKWLQEFECEFLSSDALLIDSLLLANMQPTIHEIKPIRTIGDVVFYSEIKPDMTYLVGVDPATGSGNDFSTITIFEFPTMIQVGEYRSNTMSTNDMYGTLKNVLIYLEKKCTNLFFSIENNGVGEGMISLYEADDHPPEAALFVSEDGTDKRGFTTTNKSKMKACINLKEMLENGSLKIKSRLLLSELKTYARRRGTYSAQAGSTDDLISGVLIVMRLIEEMSSYDQVAFDKLYSSDFEQWSEDDYNSSGDYDNDDGALPIVM